MRALLVYAAKRALFQGVLTDADIASVLAILFLTLISAGYLLYGNWVAKQFGVDDAHITPSHAKRDGTDHVPTPPFYLFGQHFSAIAAAAPSPGPFWPASPLVGCRASSG